MKNKIFIICILTHFHVCSLAQNTGIGITTPAGKLHIKGSADASQLIIDANSTQSNVSPLIRLRNSSGSDLMHIHSDNILNTFIGLNSGRVNVASGFNGVHNSFIGSGTGYSNTSGYANTATGSNAFFYNTSGYGNTALGASALFLNDIGYSNTAIGASALENNTTASENIAIGVRALNTQSFNNGGSPWISANTAVGFYALYSNQPTETFNGIGNTAIGHGSLRSNTTGSYNIASGGSALFYNTIGFANTASGYKALNANTKGYFNTANGYNALSSNTTANNNTAIGREALYTQSYANAGGTWNSNNTAVGSEALYYNAPVSTSTAVNNTAVGSRALYSNTTGQSNTAVGTDALSNNTTGFANIAIGFGAGTATNGLYNTISIGNYGWLNGFQNQAFIGNESTAWIGGWVGWQIYSDSRIKNNVKEDVKGLDFITRLRPVTYHRSIKAMKEITGNKETEDYPGKYDVEKIKYTGFLAQEVEKAAQESGYDFSGIQKPKSEHDLYSLTYAEFVVPLVKAVQEQQQIINELKKEIELLKRKIEDK